MRSKWKGPFLSRDVFKALQKKINVNKNIIIYSKSSSILFNFIDYIFKVYNGLTFKILIIKKYMVGNKFGEYMFTRVRNINHFKFLKLKKKK
jgi:ribosomal protein S19